MIVSTSLMIGDISLSVARRSRSSTSSPCSVSRTSEIRKPDAASCKTLCVAFAQHDVDGAGRGDVRYQTHSEGAGQIVQPIEVGRIGHRDMELSVFAPQWHELITHHQVNRNLRQE